MYNNGMEMPDGYIDSLKATQDKQRRIDRRSFLIGQMTEHINMERPCRYKVGENWKVAGKVTARTVAIKVGHLKNVEELEYLHSICKDAQNRKGSYAQVFFGSLK